MKRKERTIYNLLTKNNTQSNVKSVRSINNLLTNMSVDKLVKSKQYYTDMAHKIHKQNKDQRNMKYLITELISVIDLEKEDINYIKKVLGYKEHSNK